MSQPDIQLPVLLLVEDSDDDLFFFKRTLRRAAVSCHFVRASDGGAAIELLKKSADGESGSHPFPTIIFLDLKMPVQNGFEVLGWIQNQGFSQKPLIVVLSGSNEEKDRVRSQELGAADYLVKPVTTENLAKYMKILTGKPGSTVLEIGKSN